MSVVYSPNELANNRYPQPDGHQEAARQLISDIGEMVPEPGLFAPVTGALVYGSVALDKEHRRSDVDFFMRVAHDTPEALDETFDYIGVLAAGVEHQTGVHVQLNVQVELPLEAGGVLVNDDPFMTACIAHAATASPYVWGDPAKELLKIEDMPWNVILDAAMRSTIGFLAIQRDRLSYGEGDLDTLEGALDLPGALGRYMLRLRSAEQGDGQYVAADRASKRDAEAFMLAEGSAGVAALHGQIVRLTAMNTACTDITEAVITGDTTIADYTSWLEDTMPRAFNTAYELTKTAGLVLALRSIDVLDGK